MSEVSTGNASEAAIGNESAKESTEQGQENQQPQAPIKKKYKYKADGNEFEEELGDDEIASRLSLAKAANKRMQEASMTKKQIEQFVRKLKEDPMSILSDERIMGNQKFRQVAEQFLLKQIEEESLSPQEREYRDKERRLSEYERREKEQKEQAEKQQASELEKKYMSDYEKTIISALNTSGLPKNPYTVSKMASLMQKNLQHGLELEPQQLAQLVREDYQNELKSVIGSAEPEQLLSMFGEDVANKIRKHDLSKFQVKNPEPKQASQKTEEPQKKMSSREYDEYLRSKWQKK